MRIRELGLVAALLLICIAVSFREPRFLRADNLEQVGLSATLVCMVAYSAFVSAAWLKANPDGSMFYVLAIGAAVGLVMGLGNALLVVGARIPAIVVTLGTLAIYRGFVLVYAGGEQISATVLPDRYQAIAQTYVAGVPLLVWIAAIFTVVFGWAAR